MPFDQLSLERKQRIDAVCRGFEDARQDDVPQSLATFLERLPVEDREDGLFELLAIDIELRMANQEQPTVDHYRSQFPHDLERVERIFEQVHRELAAGSTSGTPEPFAGGFATRQLGDFRLVREIGRGGMGLVFEAVQESLERRVALKVLPRNGLVGGSGSQRFERESRAVARLHHSHIVEIYGRGEHDGVPYFAMQFIDGVGLDQMIREAGSSVGRAGKPVLHLAEMRERSRVAARIGFEIASALHYAHSQGVLHRDVKPSNILIDRQGVAWLADFGLAKLVTGADSDDGSLTEQGDMLGTLRYMAPENFHGRTDERSDVYCLGLTLLELLTLRPAHDTPDRNELLQQRLRGDLPRLELLNLNVPRDLATIIRKAIDSEASGRYQTAGEFAADLQRFLDDEPVRARRVSTGEQLRRWARRNKALATSLLATMCLLVLSTIGAITAATYFKGLESEQRTLANEKGILAQHNAELADSNGSLAAKSGELARKNERLALEASDERNRATLLVSDVFAKQGLDAAAAGRDREALVWFAGAAAKSQPLDADRYRINVNRFRRLSRQMARPVANLPIHSRVLRMQFHPHRGILLARFQPPQPDVLLDIVTQREIALPKSVGTVQSLAWSPDGNRLSVGGEGRVTTLRFPELDQPAVINDLLAANADATMGSGSQPAIVWQIEHDASGRYLALVVNSTVRVWDTQHQRFLGPPLPHPAQVAGMTFSPDGRWLVTIDNANHFRAFKRESLEDPGKTPAPALEGLHLLSTNGNWLLPVFVRGGTAMLTSHAQGVLEVWDLARQQSVEKIAHTTGIPNCFLTLGDEVFVGGHSGSLMVRFDPHQPAATTYGLGSTKLDCMFAAVDPARGNLLVGYAGQDSELWSLPEKLLLPHSVSHATDCSVGVFSRNGRFLATNSGYEETLRISELPDTGPSRLAVRLSGDIHHAAFSPDSHHAAVWDYGGSVVVWDLQTWRQVAAFTQSSPASPGPTTAVRFLPDLERLAVYQRIDPQHSLLDIWSWKTGKRLQSLPLPVESTSLFTAQPIPTPDGRHLLISLSPGKAVLFDLTAIEIKPEFVTDDAVFAWQSISPDGAWIAGRLAAARTTSVLVQRPTSDRRGDAATPQGGQVLVKLGPFDHQGTTNDVAVSPDGKLIATSAWDHTAKVWEPRWPTSDAPASPLLLKTLQHPAPVYYSEFSRDKRHLLTVSKDATARVWDIASGQVVGAPMTSVQDLAARFRPGHDELVVVDFEGHIDIWDWRRTTRLWPTTRLFKQTDAIWTDRRSLVLSPDGRYAAVGGQGAVHLVDLSPLDDRDVLAVSELVNEAELLSGQRLLPNGQPTKLTSEEWMKRFQESAPNRSPGPAH